jgi:hypothetical protein
VGTPLRAAAQGVLGERPVVFAGLSDDIDRILAASGRAESGDNKLPLLG